MQVPFRQGIITHPVSSGLQDFLQINGAYIDLNASNGDTEVTIAHLTTNYHYVESASVSQAWGPFTASTNQWLYWDINLLTGARTFGITLLEPVYQTTVPSSPSENQHWFDTVNTAMKVYTSGTWVVKARVFAAQFNGVTTFTTLAAGVGTQSFAGGQGGSLNGSNLTGRIVFDNNGDVVIKSSGELFTTEDQFFASGSQVNSIRLESNVYQGTSTVGTIAAYDVVKVITDGGLQVADYDDTGNAVIALALEDIALNEVGAIVIQGVVKNPAWSWSTVGGELWVSGTSGQLTETDPNAADPVTYQVKQVPVARVLSQNEIIFEQGLGGVGKTGATGAAGVTTGASWGTISGTLSDQTDLQLELTGKSDVGHTQAATTVTVTAAGTISSADVQAALEELDGDITTLSSSLSNYLPLAGGTMSGAINMGSNLITNVTDPVNPQDAATRAYVLANAGGGQLSDLSDVGATTATNRNVLVADGDSWESRALVEADISDLGSYLPLGGGTLSGAISMGSNLITNVTDPTNPQEAATKAYVDNNAGGSDLEVKDEGSTITIGATSINFTGNGVAVYSVGSPASILEINIPFGVAAANLTEYCPGYTYTFVDAFTFEVVGFNVTNLFSVGRRLKFLEGITLTYGEISNSSYSGGDTVITMIMDDDPLTAGVTEFCLVTGAAAWSPIAGDPFGGTAINSIVSGNIGVTVYWVMVGDGGKVAYSTNGGVSWTLGSYTGSPASTSENLYHVDYNPDSETFIAVGNGEVIMRSTDGINWDIDRSFVLAEKTDGPGDVLGVLYFPKLGPDEWMIAYQSAAAGTIAMAYSTDDGLSWTTFEPSLQTNATNIRNSGINTLRTTANALLGVGYAGTNEDVYYVLDRNDITDQYLLNTSTFDVATAILSYNFPSTAHFVGRADGEITRSSSNFDLVTFGSSAIRAFAYSPTHSRVVAVGDSAKLAYIEEADMGSGGGPFNLVANNAAPLSHFTDVHWNDTDGVFVAVNNVGQVLRSTSGLGTGAAASYTGWTLINSTPFGSTSINAIATGTISGTQWWVAGGNNGLLFTSTDAGVTWTQRFAGGSPNISSNHIKCIGYNSTNEEFFVGCVSGDFLYSTDGTTWTLDTTTVTPLISGGSGDIDSALWDPNTALWHLMMRRNATTSATYTATNPFSTWTIRSSTTQTGFVNRHASDISDDGGSVRIFYGANNNEDLYYYDLATDTSASIWANFSATGEYITAVNVKFGTLGSTYDLVFGDIFGTMNTWDNVSKGRSENLFTGQVNGIAFSSVSNRYIAVGTVGEIFTCDGTAIQSSSWISVTNPFSGIANINHVAYNAVDDMFIAVGSTGEIGRSTDGISTIGGSP